MRLRAPLAVAVTTIILGASSAVADPTGRYVYLTPTAGFTIFDGKIRYPSQSLRDAAYLGGRVGYRLLPWLGLEAAGGFSSTGENAPGGKDASFYHFSGNLVLSGYTGVLGGPFLSFGAGASKLSPDDTSAVLNIPGAERGDVDQGNLEAAGGWNYWATDKLGIRLEGRALLWLPQEKYYKLKPLTRTMIVSAAVTYALGAQRRDTDGDRIPDRADRCPATPRGARVDASGCPHDTDGDGVLDGIDQCPTTPQRCTIDARGCESDADGDGVCDGIDTCADTPKGATVDSVGCPHDADGDGVLDGIDQCADTPRGAKVDDKGCPVDSDGDGVPDGLDQCANTATGIPVDSTGCPIGFREREQELLDTGKIRLTNVQFATGKADLTPQAFPVLDAVGDLLANWPELSIEIAGHTDSRGSRKLNATLSQARADSVRAYLLRRFPQLKPEQFVAKGYGPSVPIATNDSEAGRALNRRVEFVVRNRGVLIRELERRAKPATPDTTRTPASPEGSTVTPPPAPPPTPPPAPPPQPAPTDTTQAPSTPPGSSETPPPPPPAPPPAPPDTTGAPADTTSRPAVPPRRTP